MTTRRAALVAAVVLGAAFVVVMAVRTPWVPLPEPPGGYTPIDPTAGLLPEQVARAEAFGAALRPASLLSLLISLGVLIYYGRIYVGLRRQRWSRELDSSQQALERLFDRARADAAQPPSDPPDEENRHA